MGIILTTTALLAAREHARSAEPEECCGLLAGPPGRIQESWPFPNAASDPHRRYEIAPADLISAQKQARAASWRILGVYHSHPVSPARFSATDREYAVPWFLYLILGVDGWRLFDPEGHEVAASVIE